MALNSTPIRTGTESGTGSGTSFTPSFATAATSGNLLIAAVSVTQASRTFTASAGWTAGPYLSGTLFSYATFWKISNGTETGLTITAAGGTCSGGSNIYEFDGSSLAGTLDASSSGAEAAGVGADTGVATGSSTSGLAVAIFGADVSRASLSTSPAYTDSMTRVGITSSGTSRGGFHVATKLISASSNDCQFTSGYDSAYPAEGQAGCLMVFGESGGSSPATLTTGSPASNSVASPTSQTISCSTDVSSGTARVVIDSLANMDAVTASQILAGHSDVGSAAAYDSGNITVSTTTISHTFTGLAAGLYRYGIAHSSAGGESNVLTGVILVSHSGYSHVTIGTPNTTADNRITAVDDIVSGDIIDWGDVSGTGTVVINNDGTFDTGELVIGFTVYVGDFIDGWGAPGVQTIEPDTIITSPDSYTITPVSNANPNTNQVSSVFTPTGYSYGVAIACVADAGVLYRVSLDGGVTWGGFTGANTSVTRELGAPWPQFQVSMTSAGVFNQSVSKSFSFGGVSASFTVTTRVANVPVLSGLTAARLTPTSLSYTVSTDYASGDLRILVSTSPTATESAILASGITAPVVAIGNQSGTITGLTAGQTVYIHVLHDGEANSIVVDSSAVVLTLDPVVVIPSGTVVNGLGAPITKTYDHFVLVAATTDIDAALKAGTAVSVVSSGVDAEIIGGGGTITVPGAVVGTDYTLVAYSGETDNYKLSYVRIAVTAEAG